MELNRRQWLAMGGAALVGSRSFLATPAFGGSCTPGQQAIEVFPTSPLILEPFRDPLPIPKALAPVPLSEVAGWSRPPGPGIGQQDSDGGTHQIWPSKLGLPDPIIYQIKLQTRPHSISESKVQTLVDYTDRYGNRIRAGTIYSSLPYATIYGFNGTFPGPRINAEYGRPCLVRFENHLDENPYSCDRYDFGAPDLGFLTHLHNGHTAPESDGNPNYNGCSPLSF